MVVKIFLTLDLDEEDYPVPADGDPSEEIQEAVEEFIHDIDGLKIKNIKVISTWLDGNKVNYSPYTWKNFKLILRIIFDYIGTSIKNWLSI